MPYVVHNRYVWSLTKAISAATKKKRIIYFEIPSNPERESTWNLFVRHSERRYRDVVSCRCSCDWMQLWNKCNVDDQQTRCEERVSLSGFYLPSGGGSSSTAAAAAAASTHKSYRGVVVTFQLQDTAYLIHGKLAVCGSVSAVSFTTRLTRESRRIRFLLARMLKFNRLIPIWMP